MDLHVIQNIVHRLRSLFPTFLVANEFRVGKRRRPLRPRTNEANF